VASPTALAVDVDLPEYSRFEPERDTIHVTVTPSGVGLAGEAVTVTLYKARRARDEAAGTKTLNLVDDNPATISFHLPDINDAEEVTRVRRGDYFIKAVSVSDPSIEGDSPNFIISLISVARLKSEYLHGTDQLATDIRAVKEQPVAVTGVTVIEVSKAHPMGWHELSYNYSDPGGGDPIVRLLSWCGGPTVTIEAGKSTYLLRRGNTTAYVKVHLSSITALPTQSRSEELLVDYKPLDDARMRAILDQAISWVEDSALTVFLEPTRIVSEIDTDMVSFPPGSDIPELVGADWDCRKDALTYYAPSAGHWINVKWPYIPLIRMEELYGKASNVRIVDIALEWVEFHERGGFLELVPFNQEVAFNFIGLVWIESLRGPVPIPNFWNFTALVGFRKIPGVLLELVAKKAAMDMLILAGQALRGGISSQSISRDGVSESVSYNVSGQYGVYGPTISSFQKWIDDNLKELRGAFRGPNLSVL
jgi:hypothetical protein